MKAPDWLKQMIFLSYLEGMRESKETIEMYNVETLRGKIENLERELNNPCRNASRNPIRAVQNLPLLEIQTSGEKVNA